MTGDASSLPSKPAPSTTHRRFARALVDFAAVYAVDGRNGTRDGRISDLSPGGVRLLTDEDLAQGSVVVIRFSLPNVETTLSVRGRVVLSYFDAGRERFAHGIAFTQADTGVIDAVGTFVTEQQRAEARRRTEDG